MAQWTPACSQHRESIRNPYSDSIYVTSWFFSKLITWWVRINVDNHKSEPLITFYCLGPKYLNILFLYLLCMYWRSKENCKLKVELGGTHSLTTDGLRELYSGDRDRMQTGIEDDHQHDGCKSHRIESIRDQIRTKNPQDTEALHEVSSGVPDINHQRDVETPIFHEKMAVCRRHHATQSQQRCDVKTELPTNQPATSNE